MPQTPGTTASYTFSWGGRTRTFWVYVPVSPPTEKMAVVVGLHAGTQDAAGFQSMTGLNGYADSRGFVAIYPEGLGNSWNAGGCCGFASNHDIDDLGFVNSMLGRLTPIANVDLTRVSMFGHSNGAMLAHDFARTHAGKVAAIGATSGGLLERHTTPQYKVPVIHIHGRQDDHVPYLGGFGPAAFDHYDHPSIPGVVIPYWIAANKANTGAIVQNFSGYVSELHLGVAPVQLVTLSNLGHVYVTSVPLNETQTILDFTRLYRRAGEMSDQAKVRVLWARRIKIDGSQVGAVEVAVRVTNAGTVTWPVNGRTIRGHVQLADGTFFRDASVAGGLIDSEIAPGGEIDKVVQYRSAGYTAGLSLTDLFQPDTLILVDVVQESVGWIGTPQASFYVRDATGLVEDLRVAADRLGLREAPYCAANVPTSGSAATVFDHTIAAGKANYYLGFTAVCLAGSRRLVVYQTDPGQVEATYAAYTIPAGDTLEINLRNWRRGPGSRVRMVVEPNAGGGTVEVHLDYLQLPWED